MGKGLLTVSAFSAERVASLSAKDHRSKDLDSNRRNWKSTLSLSQGFLAVFASLGWTLPELSIAWVLRRPS